MTADPPDRADPLAREPRRFDFFQAVRRIEGRARKAAPVGTGSDAAAEAVRFRADPSGAFPSSDIDTFRPAANGEPAGLTVTFLGLGGAFGPLPAPINEMIHQRRRRRDNEADAPGAYLDIFNHRLISLMMRVRRSHRLALQSGAPDETEQAKALQSLLGLGTPHLRAKAGAGRDLDRALLHLTGLLNQKPTSLHAVERAVGHYLGVGVQGQPLQGDWVAIPHDQRLRLGRSGENNLLGTDALLGRRAWCQSAGIRLTLGPLTLEQYTSLLPGGDAHKGLRRLLAFLLGGEVAVDIGLWLKTTVGAARAGIGKGGARLGWKSWSLSGRDKADKPFETLVTLRLGEIPKAPA